MALKKISEVHDFRKSEVKIIFLKEGGRLGGGESFSVASIGILRVCNLMTFVTVLCRN